MNYSIRTLIEKIISLFDKKQISYEWTGSLGHEDCVEFQSDAFKERRFHFYIPKMAWEGIESYFAEKIAEYVENGELYLKEEFCK